MIKFLKTDEKENLKFDILDKMHKFLEKSKLPKFIEKETDNLKSPISVF